ncbi:MAG: hypothetical protein AAF623_01255 [Planctomycetota bacterium]
MNCVIRQIEKERSVFVVFDKLDAYIRKDVRDEVPALIEIVMPVELAVLWPFGFL